MPPWHATDSRDWHGGFRCKSRTARKGELQRGGLVWRAILHLLRRGSARASQPADAWGCALSERNGRRLAVKRWSIFALPFVVGAFMAVQCYAASHTWGIVNPNTIAIVALSVVGTLFLLVLVAATRSRG